VGEKGIQDTLTFKLMVSIAELVQSSGVTRQEASAAIKAAGALITEMALPEKPTMEIHS
jgi:plasmid maintenance system antidote protein VapI